MSDFALLSQEEYDALKAEIERLRAEIGRLEARLRAEAETAARQHSQATEERERSAKRAAVRASQVHEELERLRAEVARWQAKALDVDQHPAIVALRQERDEAREDRKRLDWCESHPRQVNIYSRESIRRWSGCSYPTLREAIDAERRETTDAG